MNAKTRLPGIRPNTDVLGGMVRSGAVGIGDPDATRKLSTQTFHTEGLLNAGAFSDKDVRFAFDLERGWMYYLEVVNYGDGTLGAWRIGAKR